MPAQYISQTPLLNFDAPAIQALITQRGWRMLAPGDRIGSVYHFVRNEILFGYNSDDDLPATSVLSDGYGQCNTKATLLIALLRAVDIPCRFHGFTIDKGLQRGVVPELVYPIAPRNILHSWVEVRHEEKWLELEGFILDQDMLSSLQAEFPGRNSLCAYGAGTDSLQAPDVDWRGKSTYIQRTGINRDFGIFASPDDFYKTHKQLTGLRGYLYRHIIRHWMNRRVARIRAGEVPAIPGGDKHLLPQKADAKPAFPMRAESRSD